MNDTDAGDKAMRLSLGIRRRLVPCSTDRHGVRTRVQRKGGSNGGFSFADLEKLYAPLIEDPSLWSCGSQWVVCKDEPSVLNGWDASQPFAK